MLSVRTKVNSRLSQKLIKDAGAPYHGANGKVDDALFMTSVRGSMPQSFPTLNVDSLGEPSDGDDLDGNGQNFIISTIEIKSYTNTTLAKARKLADQSGNVMLEMGYSLIYGPETLSDVSPYCVVTRFRRRVGKGDVLYNE